MMQDYQEYLSAIFSDETETFRTPAEPDPGDTVTIRIRTGKNFAERVMLIAVGTELAVRMEKTRSDRSFDWYEIQTVCLEGETAYCFRIERENLILSYDKTGVHIGELPDTRFAFRFTPGFHVPFWAKGTVQYQIFTDRFRNGNTENDVTDNEYYYISGHAKHAENWNSFPTARDIRTFYGGDLQGVLEKLDYLQSLGVEAIYFNPLFVSPSSHKYDTQDYDHIDPHLAVITEDMEHPMQDWEKHNGYAPRYILRTTSAENLRQSDAFFADFCREVHRRGMRIILDGVFNHCGSFHKWMDGEGIYLGTNQDAKGARQDPESPYRGFFRFKEKKNGEKTDKFEYEGWWNHETLPKLNYEGSEQLRETILRIAEKWASPPYSIDGWRLDVAADLGHSPEFNHAFWKEFRHRLKAINPELLIIAEHYGDPREWLHGDEWDTVMNYDAFMDPVSYFLTGMEKHSDEKREDLYLNGPEFFRSILQNMSAFERPSLECAMNELSNHDHSRFLTRTNGQIGRLTSEGSVAAGGGIRKNVFRQAVLMQMTWPGAPTIYYADEAGQVGWTDPDNRRTYPWGNEDQELIDFHRRLTKLRKDYSVLRSGSLIPLHAGNGTIAYARFDDSDAVIVAVNGLKKPQKFTLRAVNAGIPDGSTVTRILLSGEYGTEYERTEENAVADGIFTVTLPAGSAAVYVSS